MLMGTPARYEYAALCLLARINKIKIPACCRMLHTADIFRYCHFTQQFRPNTTCNATAARTKSTDSLRASCRTMRWRTAAVVPRAFAKTDILCHAIVSAHTHSTLLYTYSKAWLIGLRYYIMARHVLAAANLQANSVQYVKYHDGLTAPRSPHRAF